MGFWHTGYLDKIDTGYEGCKFSAKPKLYKCLKCAAQFLSQEELFQHRFQEHPFTRPTLMHRGVELPSSPKVITKSLQISDLMAAGCNKVTVNGNVMSLDKFENYMLGNQSGIKSIVLSSDDISAEYEIRFQIHNVEELDKIDSCFYDLMSQGLLTIELIGSFIDSTKKYTTAKRYSHGIAQYLYGILVKDQKGGSSLDFGEFKDKYNESLDILHDFETPLSRIVSGILNFNFNVFDHDVELIDSLKLVASMRFFQNNLFGGKAEQAPSQQLTSNSISRDKIPLDSYTDRIISWSLASVEEIDSVTKLLQSCTNNRLFSPDDHFKLVVITASHHYKKGEYHLVRELVRPLVNDSIYGDWAANLIKYQEI